jgi:uncharacterized membrane protein
MAQTTAGNNYLAGALTGVGTVFSAANAYLAVGDSAQVFAASHQTLLVQTNYVEVWILGIHR